MYNAFYLQGLEKNNMTLTISKAVLRGEFCSKDASCGYTSVDVELIPLETKSWCIILSANLFDILSGYFLYMEKQVSWYWQIDKPRHDSLLLLSHLRVRTSSICFNLVSILILDCSNICEACLKNGAPWWEKIHRKRWERLSLAITPTFTYWDFSQNVQPK